MQAHVFAWSDKTQALRHLCRYDQQVFRKLNNTSRKEFGMSTDVQDFRIMTAAIVKTTGAFYAAFGTSSGQLILEKLSIQDGKFQLRQV